MIKIESLKDIEQLIKDGVEEGLTLEYKKDINDGKIAKEVCAFANVRGEVLVFGVIEEARKPIKLIGINPIGAEERILNIVRDSIQPDIADIIKVIQPFPIESSDKSIGNVQKCSHAQK